MSAKPSSNNGAAGAQPQHAAHPLDSYSVMPKGDSQGDQSPYFKSAAPTISLPKGGGALKGIDEKFSVNAVNGTAGMEVALPLTPGRGGFTPSLALSYNSGSGNSAFGLGWSLGLPSIRRKTDKQLPLYNDAEELDIFLLAGAEDLVPKLYESGGSWLHDEQLVYINIPGITGAQHCLVKQYRPRIEGLFARIEHIRHESYGSWWRVTTKENIITWYGLTPEARIYDPSDYSRIFEWLPQLVVDGKGNVQQFVYKHEDFGNVPTDAVYERNRNNGLAPCTNLYLKNVRYCNLTPFTYSDPYAPALSADANDFMMEAVLDYGEHTDTGSPAIPAYTGTTTWAYRPDAFSDYRAGFEIRTWRRCHRVLMFHRFAELGGGPVVARSLDITYNNGTNTAAAEATFITAITQTGYNHDNVLGWQKKSLPAMTMDYQPLQWNSTVVSVLAEDVLNAPQGLTGPYQWTDLWGEGLPGILTEQGDSWWYKSNLGGGHFSPALPVAQKPSFSGLSKGALQLADLDADGRRQAVVRQPGSEGYFELDDNEDWQPFQAFKETVHVNWNSPYTKLLDLDGDGRPDLLLAEDRVWTWFKNKGTQGYSEGGIAPSNNSAQADGEEYGPRLVLQDDVQSIFLADMSGDGLTDLVRIKNGEVCYWPNLGWGQFGARVTMANAPVFDTPDLYNPLYLQLADISGTGAADLIYLAGSSFKIWTNLAGNAFGNAYEVATLPGMEPYSKVGVMDFLGNGTGCIVWSSPLLQHAAAPLRYVDLMGGVKPYIMTAHHNGMGKTVSVHYKSSTQYYLADKAAGKPWATRLPFPVQCVESVTTTDTVSETSYTQTYSYHHGYYDHEEREFRGFGRVETIDTDEAQFDPNGVHSNILMVDQAPVLTKTWFHNGAWIRERSLLDAFADEYYHFTGWDKLSTQATFELDLAAPDIAILEREAHRAMKGSALRQEVYALDGSSKQDKPYTVTVSAYTVKMVQPRWAEGERKYASFRTEPQQSLSWSCERDLGDARLSQSLTLETDEYGNVLRSTQVVYPRKGGTRVRFADIHAALSTVDITKDNDLETALNSLLGISASADSYRKWLTKHRLVLGKASMSAGRISLPDAPQFQMGSGAFSIEAWINPSASNYESIFEYLSETHSGAGAQYPGGGAQALNLFLYNGTAYLYQADVGGALSYAQAGGSATLAANTWSHLIAVKGSNSSFTGWTFFLNGIELVPTALSAFNLTDGNLNFITDAQVQIGSRTLGPADALNGSVRDVRLYNRIINGTEAALLYNSGAGRTALSGAVLDLPMYGAATGPASDISGRFAKGACMGNAVLSYELAAAAPAGEVIYGLPLNVSDAQLTCSVIYNKNTFTGDAIDSAHYHLRMPATSKSYELTGLVTGSTLFTPAGILSQLSIATEIDYLDSPSAGVELRLLSNNVVRYLSNDTLNHLAVGDLESLALVYRQYQLAFTEKYLDTTPGNPYSNYVNAAKLNEGGYHLHDGKYWLRSGIVNYLTKPTSNFYTPEEYIDPFGNVTSVSYGSNAYWLLPFETTDAAGNTTLVNSYDWRNLQPLQMTDMNGNTSAVCYDALGMPVATAIMGKGSEADYLKDTGGSLLVADSSTDLAAQAAFWSASSAHDLELAADALLGRATWRCIYDLSQAPVAVAMIGRERHYEDNHSSTTLIRITYTDGLGRVIMNKVRAADIPASGSTPALAQWIGSGRVIYNNKGKAVMQFEPYFSATHTCDTAAQAAASGVSPRIYYDPLGRAYATYMPDGSFTTAEWDNWTQRTSDAGDNVTYSQWRIDRSTGGSLAGSLEERDALTKSMNYAGTLSTAYLDSLGRPFYTVQHNRTLPGWNDDFTDHYEVLDILGNRLEVWDGNGLNQLSYRYNLLKAPCYQHSIDGNDGHMLLDVAAQPLYHWDAAGTEFRSEYDGLRRPVRQWGGGALLSKISYGEGAPNDTTLNLRGQVIASYDGAGKHYVNEYDFKGQPKVSYMQLLTDPTLQDADWSQLTDIHDLNQAETFFTEVITDALGRPLSADTGRITGGGTEHNITYHTYEKDGALKAVVVGSATYVQDIHHNARGQREAIWYGNGTKTSYTYDPLSHRLSRLYTVNLATNKALQDLNYYYDIAGNITTIRDDAQEAVWFANSIVTPGNDYTYDALYRLVQASGRERIASATFGMTDNSSDQHAQLNGPSDMVRWDGSALQRYLQTYSYDAVGNMLQLSHGAPVGGYTRDFTYQGGSNRLSTTRIGTAAPYSYSHDARGNMTAMPHLGAMDYDLLSQMTHITAGNVEAYYQYSGGNRVKKFVDKTATSNVTEERIYFGNYEVYRKWSGGSTPDVERTTIHVSDDQGRIAMIEKRTSGTDLSPAFLKRFIYSNHLGSASLELDGSAAIISYEEYHPYGTTAYQAMDANINAVAKRYRYTGKERDEESGLNYHGARYYALWLCRWCAVDPLEGKYAGWSAYQYCTDNPINHTDSTGMGNDGDLPDKPVNKYGEKQVYTTTQTEVLSYDPAYTTTDVTTKHVPQGSTPISQGLSKTDLYRLAVGRVLHPGEFKIGNNQYLDEKYFEAEGKAQYYFSHLSTATMADSPQSRELTKDIQNRVVEGLFSNDKTMSDAAVEMIDRRTSFWGKMNWAKEIGLLIDGGGMNSIIKSTVTKILVKESEKLSKDVLTATLAKMLQKNLSPNAVKEVDKIVMNKLTNEVVTDLDIVLDKHIIEVTGGKGKGKLDQIMNRIKPNAGGKEVILFAPRIGGAAEKGLRKENIKVFKNFFDLYNYLKH